MSLCVICMTKKATVPDKNRPGKPVNRFCLACHEQKLIDDLQMALVSQAEYHAAAQDAAIYGHGFVLVSAENVEHISAAEVLAQQPEEQQPVEGEEIMVNTPYDVFTLPLQPSGLLSGPRFVVHVPGPEQQPAPDVAALVEALEAALMVMTSKEVRLEKQADAITMVRSQLAAHRKQGDEQ